MKTCSKCKVEKDLNNFVVDERYADGRGSWCRECRRELAKAYMAKNAKNPVNFEDITDSVKQRFFAKVDKTDTCWNWTGATTATRKNRAIGYGSFLINKRPFYAHRLSFLMHNGYLTEGLVVDHQCNNTLCVNPEHLKEMTSRENVWRSPIFKGNVVATHCKYGHPRGPELKGKPCPVCWSPERLRQYVKERYEKNKLQK